MTLKNNRVPLLSNIKLCASFHRNMWIQNGVTVQKRLNGAMTSVTLTSDLVVLHGHHVCNGNNSWKFQDDTITGTLSKRCDRRTDRQTEISVLGVAWSQLKIIGHLFNTTSSFVHLLKCIGKFKLKPQSGNAQFGSISAILSGVTLKFDSSTLKNFRASLLCCSKLCASFQSHR